MRLSGQVAAGLLALLLSMTAQASRLSDAKRVELENLVRGEAYCGSEEYCSCLLKGYVRFFTDRDVGIYNFFLTQTAPSFGMRNHEVPNLINKMAAVESSCEHLQPTYGDESGGGVDDYEW
mgnify:CR=1 FL=1